MRSCCTLVICSAIGFLVAGESAHGQAGTGGTITSNDAVFRMADSPTLGTGTGAASADFRVAGASGTDQCFQHWWWVRVVGTDTREYCLANATSPSWTGDTGSMTFVAPAYTAVATWKVAGGPTGSGRGQVTAKLRLTNTGAATANLAVFSYLDYDLAGTIAADTSTLLAPNRIGIADGATSGEFYAPGAAAYQVAAFAQVRNLLADTSVTNLANSGLPFAPADWTGAFQYNLSLNPGAVTTVTCVLALNQTATAGCPVDTDGDGLVQPSDISLFVNTWFNDLGAGTLNADFDANGSVQPADVSAFVAAWFAAVSSGTC